MHGVTVEFISVDFMMMMMTITITIIIIITFGEECQS